VPEAASIGLLAPLRRIRRRLRLWRALDGAIVGSAAGLVVAAGTTAALHHRGQVAGVLPLTLVLGAAALGAALRAARRISLVDCARRADAALDRQDRVLSALDLADRSTSPLAAALVADAVGRLAELVPARAVPHRPPRGFPALAGAAAIAALAAISPVRSRASVSQPSAVAARKGARLPAGALDAERDAARAAARVAERLADERLAKLASELERTLARLASGALDDGPALDALRALAAEAAAAARAAERERAALDAAAETLARQASTRAAAEALRAGGDGAGEKAGAALGRSADAHPADTGRALAAAARSLAGTGAGPDGSPGERGRRRLAREGRESSSPQAGDDRRDPESERHLEQLSRDLDGTAASCRDGAEGCRAEAERRGRELAQLGQRGSAAEALRQLERAAQQARARLGRGDLRQEEGAGAAQRRFQRAAEGEQRSDTELESGGEEGAQRTGAGNGSNGSPGGGSDVPGQDGRTGGEHGRSGRAAGEPGGNDGEGEGESEGTVGRAELPARAERSGGSAEGGDGIGHDPGGPALGRPDAPGSRGHEAEARVTDGAGPNRAQVIGVAAERGFAGPGYARVFSDYEAAVEDAMGATAVPEGKRYLVRRYFDLIRPRSGGRR
jgi:hypothetical protein